MEAPTTLPVAVSFRNEGKRFNPRIGNCGGDRDGDGDGFGGNKEFARRCWIRFDILFEMWDACRNRVIGELNYNLISKGFEVILRNRILDITVDIAVKKV